MRAFSSCIRLAAALAASTLWIPAVLHGGQAPEQQPRELGAVHWLRDYDQAVSSSRAGGKPILLLFQEVPGCSTCVSFGESVLSHSLLVEAVEDEFIPVAILNNRPGEDRRILEKFAEPAWNNPVVRFVDASGKDLIPRRDRIWAVGEIARRMVAALGAADRAVPAYFEALANELDPGRAEYATFWMACYWHGEACLGSLPAVLSTSAGHSGGREVVELRFDAERIAYGDLLAAARERGCADGVFAHDDRQLAIARRVFGDSSALRPGHMRTASQSDRKFHLERAKQLSQLELTPAQAAKINAGLWAGEDVTPLLSPRQRGAISPAER